MLIAYTEIWQTEALLEERDAHNASRRGTWHHVDHVDHVAKDDSWRLWLLLFVQDIVIYCDILDYLPCLVSLEKDGSLLGT